MEEKLITPTQNIVFAVLKDGDTICNLKEDGEIKPEYALRIFRSLRDSVEKMDNRELAAFSLAFLIENRLIGETITKRFENIKQEKYNR